MISAPVNAAFQVAHGLSERTVENHLRRVRRASAWRLLFRRSGSRSATAISKGETTGIGGEAGEQRVPMMTMGIYTHGRCAAATPTGSGACLNCEGRAVRGVQAHLPPY